MYLILVFYGGDFILRFIFYFGVFGEDCFLSDGLLFVVFVVLVIGCRFRFFLWGYSIKVAVMLMVEIIIVFLVFFSLCENWIECVYFIRC